MVDERQHTAMAAGRLIIVDDDPAVAKSVSAACAVLGVETESFHSPAEFLASFHPAAPCCIVLDLKLPGMSGLELLERLKKGPYVPPVIMISGHGDIPSAVEAMHLGAVTFLEKPFSYDLLRRHIADALARAVKNWERITGRARAVRLLDDLKPRELEMLDLLVAGRSNKQMAPLLDMSIRGVEDRRARIMQKLEVESVAELCQLVHLARTPQPV